MFTIRRNFFYKKFLKIFFKGFLEETLRDTKTYAEHAKRTKLLKFKEIFKKIQLREICVKNGIFLGKISIKKLKFEKKNTK